MRTHPGPPSKSQSASLLFKGTLLQSERSLASWGALNRLCGEARYLLINAEKAQLEPGCTRAQAANV